MDANSLPTRVLTKLAPREQVAALASAWPHASAAERREYGWVLLQLVTKDDRALRKGWRTRWPDEHATVPDQALGLLAGGWCDLESDARKLAVAAGRSRWAGALEALGEEGVLAAGRALSELAMDSGDVALVPALGLVLRRGASRGVQAAARALLVLALRHTSGLPSEWLGAGSQAALLRLSLDPESQAWTPADGRVLLAEVAEGVSAFETHGRKEVLLAALVLLEGPSRRLCPADPLAAMARDPDSTAFATLRTAFRRGRVPLARQRAWVWLREDPLAAACLDRLRRAKTPADHQVVLELGHLSLAPARRRRLALLSIATRPAPARTTPPGVSAGPRLHPEGPLPDRAAFAGLSVVARRQLPRVVSAMEGTRDSTALALEGMLTDSDPVARLAAARAVPVSAVRDYCFDAAAPVARHAALRACSIGIAESSRSRGGDALRRRDARTLVRSPHAVVRAIGKQELDRVSIGQRSVLSRLAARRLWQADPEAFAAWMRASVEDSVPNAVDAIMTARKIGAVACVETRLLSIVRDSVATPDRHDPRIVATAVACLGELTTARVISLLEGCLLRHADPRVRSNAAEALGRQRRLPAAAGLASKGFDDEHHRVRGSVVRATMAIEPKPGSTQVIHAIDVVTAMLTDARPAHRLAGVWVVQRSLGPGNEGAFGTRWDRLVGRVRWLADEDADATIRRRASVITHRVDAAMVGLGPNTAGVLAS